MLVYILEKDIRMNAPLGGMVLHGLRRHDCVKVDPPKHFLPPPEASFFLDRFLVLLASEPHVFVQGDQLDHNLQAQSTTTEHAHLV